jgi:hypothetical protein
LSWFSKIALFLDPNGPSQGCQYQQCRCMVTQAREASLVLDIIIGAPRQLGT